MEKYIKKINDRLLKKNDITRAKKIKKRFRVVGGVVLATGLAGFIACMIAFVVFFLKTETDLSFTCWMIAIPFLIMFVSGSVVTRVGDRLLTNQDLSQSQVDQEEEKAE